MSLRLASWAKPKHIHKASRRTVALLIAWSLAAVAEIIEQRHAVSFRPYADHARFGESLVAPLNGFLPVQRHDEMIISEIHSQGVPLAGYDFHVSAHLLRPLAFDRVVDGHVVFQRVGACDVIVVAVFGAPDNAARLIFFS